MMKKLNLKKIALGTVLVFAMGTMTACGGSDGGNDNIGNDSNVSETADFDVQELADKLKSDGVFKDQLSELDMEIAVNKLYGLDNTQIESGAFYTNTNATAEEIAVIKVVSADYAQTVVDAYNQRIEEQKTACENYLPDEMPKLESAVVKSQGCYVILCVSCDSSKAESIVSEYIK